MKCIFKHDWIYSNKGRVICRQKEKLTATIFHDRRCHKCGKVQTNNGYFEGSFNINEWEDNWVTIGYSQSVEEDSS